MEAKVRYKAYKAGKRWLYSAILFGSTVLTFGISHPIDAATPTEETVSLAQPAATTSLTDGSGTPKTAADSQPAQGAVSQSVTDPQAQGQASGQEMTGEQSMAASEAPKPAQAVAPSASQASTNSENSPQAPTSATPAVSQTQPPRQTISEQPAVNTSASTPVRISREKRPRQQPISRFDQQPLQLIPQGRRQAPLQLRIQRRRQRVPRRLELKMVTSLSQRRLRKPQIRLTRLISQPLIRIPEPMCQKRIPTQIRFFTKFRYMSAVSWSTRRNRMLSLPVPSLVPILG